MNGVSELVKSKNPAHSILTLHLATIQVNVLYIHLQFTVWSLISIGLNCVIILIYNDVGLLSKVSVHQWIPTLLLLMLMSHSQKEHYLGLSVSNNNWWRTNGIGCRDVGGTEGSALGSDGSSNTVKCTLSYAVRVQCKIAHEMWVFLLLFRQLKPFMQLLTFF